MRISLIQIALAIMFCTIASASKTNAQEVLQKRITLVADNQKVEKILNTIGKIVSVKFMYSPQLIKAERRISIKADNEKLETVLERFLNPLSIIYEVSGNHIILKGKPTSSNKAPREITSPQDFTITGKITDDKGEGLPGVNVLLKGTTIGTASDANGIYSLIISEDKWANGVLVFSYIGYVASEIPINNLSTINVTLTSDIKSLSEVVVVGYGTQKVVNLTGSVSSITPAEIENRPITQSSQALAGLASGITVTQGAGRPGNDASTIRIRGTGTFSGAGNDPLVLIDGLASSINDIDPNNIKSISILKDAASAAIYGTRAANGVILIETKRGQKGKLQIGYTGYAGWQKVTALPEFVDSWEWAQLTGMPADEVEKYRSGSDPDNYPNVPHLKNLLTSGSGFQTNNNINFKGGDQNNSYFLSFGYLHQDGIVAKNNYDKYNLMLNLDSKLKDNLKLQVSINSNTSNTKEPRQFEGDMMSIINYAVREGPQYAGKKSDGTYGYQDNYGPEAYMDSKSFSNRKTKYFQGGTELSWEIFKNFTLSGKAGYNTSTWSSKDYTADVIFNPNKTVGPNSLTQQSGESSLLTLQSLARYSQEFGSHKFNFLLGYSQEQYQDNYMRGSRQSFPNNFLYELNAGATEGMSAGGSGAEWALRSYFGRINYSFKERYLFEANARYDGTSRFPKKGRWGLFPSFSAGWRISEEPFMRNDLYWIDNLKLRASWGKLGNQNIGNYPYQNVLTLGENYSFGGTLYPGARLTNLANANITWESTEVINVGLDMGIFKGKLNMVFDYFNKTTSDILYKISVSNVLGLTPSEVNGGEVKNQGLEVMLNYRLSLGKLNIGISPNFSYIKNEVTKLATVEKDINQGLFVGEPLNAIYGFVADGLFINEADIASYPTQPAGPNVKPGYIRYKDLSGPDGVPDGIVDATYDRQVIGTRFPRLSYGGTISADFKGFDFSMLLQGLGGHQRQMGYYQGFALYNGGQIQRWQADKRWTPENPDRNAEYPVLEPMGLSHPNLSTSTFWSRSAGFLRLKNIQLGYTIPTNLTQRINISKLRVYVSGQNIFTFSNYYPGWDPEMDQAVNNNSPFYPITSVYTCGVNLNF